MNFDKNILITFLENKESVALLIITYNLFTELIMYNFVNLFFINCVFLIEKNLRFYV